MEIMTTRVKRDDLSNTQIKILEKVGRVRGDLKETALDLDNGINYIDRFGNPRYPYMRDSLYLNNKVKENDVNIAGRRKRRLLVSINEENVVISDDKKEGILYDGSFLVEDYSDLDNDAKVVINLLKNTYENGKSFPFESKDSFEYETYTLAYHNDKGEDLIIFPGGKKI